MQMISFYIQLFLFILFKLVEIIVVIYCGQLGKIINFLWITLNYIMKRNKSKSKFLFIIISDLIHNPRRDDETSLSSLNLKSLS